MSGLRSMPVSQIVTWWRPGSRDWSWAEEYADLIDDEATTRIHARIVCEGFSFIDDFAPVLLGRDGRVWDGHHRICLAIRSGEPSLMVDVVTS